MTYDREYVMALDALLDTVQQIKAATDDYAAVSRFANDLDFLARRLSHRAWDMHEVACERANVDPYDATVTP